MAVAHGEHSNGMQYYSTTGTSNPHTHAGVPSTSVNMPTQQLYSASMGNAIPSVTISGSSTMNSHPPPISVHIPASNTYGSASGIMQNQIPQPGQLHIQTQASTQIPVSIKAPMPIHVQQGYSMGQASSYNEFAQPSLPGLAPMNIPSSMNPQSGGLPGYNTTIPVCIPQTGVVVSNETPSGQMSAAPLQMVYTQPVIISPDVSHSNPISVSIPQTTTPVNVNHPATPNVSTQQ